MVAALDNDYNVFGTGIRPVGPDAVSFVPDTFSGEAKSGLRSVDPVASSVEDDQLDEEYMVVDNAMDQDDSMNATAAGEFNLPPARLHRVPAVDDLPRFLLAAQLGQDVNADLNASMYDEILVEMVNMNASVNGAGVGIPQAPPGTPEDGGDAAVLDVHAQFDGLAPLPAGNSSEPTEDNAAAVLDVNVQVDELDPLPADNSSEELAFDIGSDLLDSRCMRSRRRSLTDDQTDESGFPAGTFQVINLFSYSQFVFSFHLILLLQRTLHKLSLEGAEREVLLRAAECGRKEVEAQLREMSRAHLELSRAHEQRRRLRLILVVVATLLYAAILIALVTYM